MCEEVSHEWLIGGARCRMATPQMVTLDGGEEQEQVLVQEVTCVQEQY